MSINIPEFVDDVVALGNCCHGGGTAAVEMAGRGIGGGTDDGNCPTLPGGNLGGVGGNCVHGGGPDSYITTTNPNNGCQQ